MSDELIPRYWKSLEERARGEAFLRGGGDEFPEPVEARFGRRGFLKAAGFSLADGLEKRIGPWLRNRVLTLEPDHRPHGPALQPAE